MLCLATVSVMASHTTCIMPRHVWELAQIALTRLCTLQGVLEETRLISWPAPLQVKPCSPNSASRSDTKKLSDQTCHSDALLIVQNMAVVRLGKLEEQCNQSEVSCFVSVSEAVRGGDLSSPMIVMLACAGSQRHSHSGSSCRPCCTATLWSQFRTYRRQQTIVQIEVQMMQPFCLVNNFGVRWLSNSDSASNWTLYMADLYWYCWVQSGTS